jgi:hypothetical protein
MMRKIIGPNLQFSNALLTLLGMLFVDFKVFQIVQIGDIVWRRA